MIKFQIKIIYLMEAGNLIEKHPNKTLPSVLNLLNLRIYKLKINRKRQQISKRMENSSQKRANWYHLVFLVFLKNQSMIRHK